MFMPLTAEDVVSAIFYFIKQHKKEILTADREKLHRAFFASKNNHPDVLALLTFRQREQFPESSQLDQALSNLDAAGMISRQNMTPRYYKLENTLEKSYEKFSRQLLVQSGMNFSNIKAVALEIELEVVCAA